MNCVHPNEKTVIVRSDMLSTVYRSDCKDCGRSLYSTELAVPDIQKDEVQK